jgi:sugar phosphate isomerase/epimerase
MRIGYNTWAIPALSYDTVIPALARIGYTAIALSVVPRYGQTENATSIDALSASDRKRIASMCDALGIELHSVVGNQNIIEDDTEKSRAALDRLRRTIDFCVEVTPTGQAVPVLCTGAGGPTEAWDSHKGQLVDRLGDLGRYAAQRGVIICLEPHVNASLDSPAKAEWLIKAVDQPSVKLDLDMSHFMVQRYTLEEVVPRLVPLAASTEIKDQNVRYLDEPEPDGWRIPANGQGRSMSPDGREQEFQFLLGGEGDFDLPQYLRLIDAAGWRGPVCFEASLACTRRPGYDPVASATDTYKWMEAGWQAAGISGT